ncbi:response regulator transcription factor [Candidatus Uabimicrobium amorphum]|uniref:DNA-binding response regulator n=1 Tax=Uabimicrobium amorphum TaxID=2596890 RepID=A0A5S9ISR7_UABAM|nr:response regulator transcription factor [Candidatus Uabimicrobium amorphum]BBM87463.1 DNA-binding response regulator [Candidatus Uabimicrobium amorphum]
MKILLIEDDKGISSFIIKGLKQEGYVVDHCYDGVDGLHQAQVAHYDLAIIDIMLPGIDGFTVIERLRQKGVKIPFLILSARNSVDDRVKGLHKGGDDYLVKPFAFAELLARMQALLRRSQQFEEIHQLQVADLILDLNKRKVFRAGQEIDLAPRELQLLEYLMRNAGKVVSKTMIMESVWDYNFDPQTNVVEAQICRLREKIERGFTNKLIHTLRGFGYILEIKNET